MRFLLALALLGGSALADDAVHDLPSLVAAMEAAQSPIQDFRCEFEGEELYQGDPAAEVAKKFGPDGLIERFAGVFVWQRDGDRRTDLFTRREGYDYIQREITIVRPSEKKIKRSRLPNVARAVGVVESEALRMERVGNSTYLDELLPFDQIKELVGSEGHETTVADDPIDGRPLKRLTVYLKFKELPNRLARRYWIDLERSGQVVRIDGFLRDSLASRWDIELKPFRVGEAEVWMPVSGEIKRYIWEAPRRGAPGVIRDEPSTIRTIRVIDGTLEFNKEPNRAMFSLDHEPPAPKSAPLRDWTQRYDQKVAAK